VRVGRLHGQLYAQLDLATPGSRSANRASTDVLNGGVRSTGSANGKWATTLADALRATSGPGQSHCCDALAGPRLEQTGFESGRLSQQATKSNPAVYWDGQEEGRRGQWQAPRLIATVDFTGLLSDLG
jgi:hypothetical protein